MQAISEHGDGMAEQTLLGQSWFCARNALRATIVDSSVISFIEWLYLPTTQLLFFVLLGYTLSHSTFILSNTGRWERHISGGRFHCISGWQDGSNGEAFDGWFQGVHS